jgi:aspartyl/asparaginyl beta-hydroxylase (cupin superfamily)
MNHTDTFQLHGKIDVDPYIKIIQDNNLDWDGFTDRQKKFNSEHVHTKTIPIIFDKSFNFNHLKIIPTEHYPLFKDEILKIEEQVKLNTGENGKIMRALLVKLTAGKSIRPHVDTVGFSLVVGRRIHIPIQTNDDCFFTVGGDRRNLKLGEMWEINNDKKEHSVENLGETDRIHLIVDWIEESLFEKYDK